MYIYFAKKYTLMTILPIWSLLYYGHSIRYLLLFPPCSLCLLVTYYIIIITMFFGLLH